MTPRALRRAQERKAKKLARKAGALRTTHGISIAATAATGTPDLSKDQLSETLDLRTEEHEVTLSVSERPTSEVRLAANRRNALFSTGPTSETGKATSCLNALKTGLTGQTVLLPSEDATEYGAHIADYEKAFTPVGRLERDLVQSLADTRWRLNRIPRLEMAIYAQGRLEFDQSFAQHDAEQRASMIEVQTFITYEKQLKNLQIQEARLHRRYEKDLKALVELQKERRAKEEQQLAEAAEAYATARQQKVAFDPAAHGFEFSTSEIESFTNRRDAQRASRRRFNPAIGRSEAA